MEAVQIAQVAAVAAAQKKAENVVILDMRALTPVADFFVICSAPTRVQTRAIARFVRERLEEQQVRLDRQEGGDEAGWVLLDYGSVVFHVFLDQVRRYYDLERLWSDAPQVNGLESIDGTARMAEPTPAAEIGPASTTERGNP